MNSIILDALDYFNTIKFTNTKQDIKFTDETHNLLPILYIKEQDKYVKKVYNMIGIFMDNYNEFIWAWHTNIPKFKHIKTNQLLIHGLNMDIKTNTDLYIKKLLTSSNVKITNYSFLDIIIALSCYLTKAQYYFFDIDLKENQNYICFYGLYDIKDVENITLKSEL